MPLYSLRHVREALGLRSDADDYVHGEEEPRTSRPTEQQERLTDILDRGEEGRWRYAVGPHGATVAALEDLGARAPHLAEVTSIFKRNAKAASAMAVPCFAAPLLLVGEPGTGKTWLLSRVARVLGVPFRLHPMNLSSLSEALSGSHASWRAASSGLVARTLLQEREANPLIVVDELDKPSANSHNNDPFRAFYTLLDPSGSAEFVDEFLGFPMDASRVMWVAAANSTAGIPVPILDRLTVVEVASMTKEHRRVVARSIFDEQNAARGTFFGTPGHATVERLAGLPPRGIRIAVEEAMAEAAARGCREVGPDDVRVRATRSQTEFGFRF